eukprot:5171989-Pleurochrysis_carterae.AAC.1
MRLLLHNNSQQSACLKNLFKALSYIDSKSGALRLGCSRAKTARSRLQRSWQRCLRMKLACVPRQRCRC